MLNRIYIVVGIFAIVVLSGAFIAPRFIQWSDYRDRMEDLASGVLGADVTIRGDISFSLLPTPQLEFSDVIVGDLESPAATVAAVEAEFALFDFLRDIYNLTSLTLMQPVLEVVLDENGLLTSSVDVTGQGAGVSLGMARISNGSVRLTDLRADEVFTATRIDGELKMSSFIGPFQFQGAADYGDKRYDVRFNSGNVDASGSTRLTSFFREVNGGFSVNAEGNLLTGAAPKFDGTLTYRQAPPVADAADDIRGNLVLESTVSMSTDRVTVSAFTLLPDENRASMRLTGAANIQLGLRREFDAVISGGVFSLPPRDATEVASELPYEMVRLLSEIPAPPLPPMPGKLGIDLAEVSLRGFSLRELRLDAITDGKAWDIQQAVAHMPGDTEVRLSGKVGNDAGAVSFLGDLAVKAERLDALSQLWRRARDNNPLFNTPGALEGRLMLAGDAFGLSNGRFTFAGQTHNVEVRLGFGAEPRLDAVLGLGTLTSAQTNALLALAPDIASEPSFAVSFPDGSFSLTAKAMDVMGLMAEDFVAEGQWMPNELRFARLAAANWDGIGYDLALRLAGSLSDPRITGSGKVTVSSAETEGLLALYEMAGVPFGWQEGLAPSWPADLQFILTDNDADSGQVLTLTGDLGAGDFDLRAEMAEGLARLSDADLRLVASLEGDDDEAIQSQLGLGDIPLFEGDGSVVASLFVEGNSADGFEGRAGISQNEQSLSFYGRLSVAENGEISGDGSLDAILANARGLAALAGMRGASLPAIDANASVQFAGSRGLTLETISGVSGDVTFTGDLSMQRLGQLPTYSGSLKVDAVDMVGIAASLLGAEALAVPGESIWPEGPLAIELENRASRGNIAVTADATTLAGAKIFGETGFTYSWDQTSTLLDNLQAQVGDGTLSLSLTSCCTGNLSERTLSGRMALAGVDVDALLPPLAAMGLDGAATGGVQFEGTGQSVADVVRTLTGEGNFAIADFAVSGFSPEAFPSIAGIEDALNTEADAIETLISLALGQGSFEAEEARGAFSIAGGTVRIANLIVEGEGGLLSGSLNVALPLLGLDGSFVLTPRNFVDQNGLVEADTARILARLAGSILAPALSFDLTEMVASIQVRANELELDRLDRLRLEDEARQREAAEARNRLIEEQQRRAAEERARREAEEAERRALEELSAPPEAPIDPVAPLGGPLELGFQPSVNQPIGPDVNQPIQLIPPN